MRVLEQLEPKNVLSFFEDLCAIPHGSGNTKAISDYCVKFAESRGLEVHQDGLNNVVIVKPAVASTACEQQHGGERKGAHRSPAVHFVSPFIVFFPS